MRRALIASLRRAGGQPLALLLFALFLTATARAQDPSPLTLEGQPVSALAAHPDVVIGFRSVARGRSSIIARHLRAPGGQGLRVAEDRFVFGWACEGGACARDGLFLGYDIRTERFYLLLLDESEQSLTVPPRGATWPATLARAALAVRPDLRRLLPE